MSEMFQNPILSGFYPDPSICRVGEDYYLVTSSFEYFPGVPIFHSKDLVNWRQIGHVLDRPSQLNLDGAGFSRGIFAPTIRYYKGVFYVITTLIDQGGNFFVTATKPEGPWSDPVWLKAPEIDPSLFFDDDGRVWYTGNGVPKGGPQYEGHREIWLQELDLTNGQMTGPIYSLWDGAVKGAVWAEAPHIYKLNGWYYLLISEGGTGHEHAISVARSRDVLGPYKGYNRNPILTHRHLGLSYPIVNAGHGDLVDTSSGEWWIVVLASRPFGGYFRNLGRETFLAPVVWEEDWPVISPGIGRVEEYYRRPKLVEHKWQTQPDRDDFDELTLGFHWISLRTPREVFWSLSERRGVLRLRARPQSIINQENPSFLAQRQRHKSFVATCRLDPKGLITGSNAGLVAYQSGDFQLRFSYFKEAGENVLRVYSREAGTDTELGCLRVSDEELTLKIEAKEQDFTFLFSSAKNEWTKLATGVDGRLLSSDRAGGFVGTVIGVYASTEGNDAGGWADFDWFEYSELP